MPCSPIFCKNARTSQHKPGIHREKEMEIDGKGGAVRETEKGRKREGVRRVRESEKDGDGRRYAMYYNLVVAIAVLKSPLY